MNLEEAKELIKTFLSDSDKTKLKHSMSKTYNSYVEEFRSLLNAEPQLTIITLMHCILYDKPIKKCITCGKQLNIENFNIYKFGKFCSIKCKSNFDYKEYEGDEIYTDYLNLFDANGNISQSRIEKFVGKNTIKDLQNKTGLVTTDLRTLLYEILKGIANIKYCQECNTPIAFKLSKDPWPTDRLHFCSNDCRNKNEAYKENLGVKHRNIKRSESEVYRENVGIPWFNTKIQKTLDTENVTIHCTYSQFIERDLKSTLYDCTCNECGSNFKSKIDRMPWCKKCNYYSRPQKELVDFIDSFGYTTLVNDRILIAPYELDILVPELKLAIEFDGIYFHRDKNDYHKYEMCQKLGYRLVKIYDDEKTDIVKSRLASIINKSANKIYGRKCKIVNVENSVYYDFLNKNHIQGQCNASVKYGLEYDSELVAVMSFGKSRYNKDIQWELLRYVSKLNSTVVGGASKLFKHFVKEINPDSVLSYCDVRWGTGNMYEKIGFKFSHKTNCSYYYYKNKRESRVKYQKHKLPTLFENVDMTMTESEIMKMNGFSKIYDFGNYAYTWTK